MQQVGECVHPLAALVRAGSQHISVVEAGLAKKGLLAGSDLFTTDRLMNFTSPLRESVRVLRGLPTRERRAQRPPAVL